MNPLTFIFDKFLYQPLFNILILLYQYLPGNDFGIAVIVLTFLLRLVLYPIMSQSIRYQRTLNKIQPKIQELQEKHKDDQEVMAKELINIYKENKISPFSVFLPLLIQLPLLIAIFQVFKNGLQPDSVNNLYGFVSAPQNINYIFLGMMSLAEPNLILAVVTAAVQFFQIKSSTPELKKDKKKKKDKITKFSETTQRQMPYFLSALTFAFLAKLPAAMGLYWITTSLFTIGQQYISKKHDRPE